MKKISLLVINDHPIVREGLTQVLDRFEDLEVVASGASTYQLKDLVQRLQPDILMMDIQSMASIYQMATEAQGIKPDLHIVLTSSLPLPEYQRIAERIGAKGLMSAFDDPEQIVSGLKSVSEGGQFFQTNGTIRTLVQKHRDGINGRLEHPLSPREVDVLCCVAQAMTAKEIALDLQISVKTVDRHKANIMNKLNMRSQIELARYAIRNGFVEV
ncbi:MAG: response regulator transcription factor [Proteobacteria bacterium]|nr:MAG: response regulator transcription factor [Pseudomonadota bacterium]